MGMVVLAEDESTLCDMRDCIFLDFQFHDFTAFDTSERSMTVVALTQWRFVCISRSLEESIFEATELE